MKISVKSPMTMHHNFWDSHILAHFSIQEVVLYTPNISNYAIICNSILFLRFWIIFTIIIQNSSSGRFPISFCFVWFSGHLSCSFTCWVFLCLFILFIFLCGVAFPYSGSLWFLFTVEFPRYGWVGQVAFQDFLVLEYSFMKLLP